MHFREMISYQRRDPKILTQAEREARKVFAAQEAEKALSEYESAQRAFDANRVRLKAERLAREAAASKTSSLAIQDS
jgi:hypothetical protein